jgi:hypothetical protein
VLPRRLPLWSSLEPTSGPSDEYVEVDITHDQFLRETGYILVRAGARFSVAQRLGQIGLLVWRQEVLKYHLGRTTS